MLNLDTGMAAALLFGGAIIGGVGVWYWQGYVPTHYVYLTAAPAQSEQPEQPSAPQQHGARR
jgi:hypothetical protein